MSDDSIPYLKALYTTQFGENQTLNQYMEKYKNHREWLPYLIWIFIEYTQAWELTGQTTFTIQHKYGKVKGDYSVDLSGMISVVFDEKNQKMNGMIMKRLMIRIIQVKQKWFQKTKKTMVI